MVSEISNLSVAGYTMADRKLGDIMQLIGEVMKVGTSKAIK
jgi:hypothetical protein